MLEHDQVEPEDWIRDIDDERIPDNWRSLLRALGPHIDQWQVRQRKDDGSWECLVSRDKNCWTIFAVNWAYVTEAMVVEQIQRRLAWYERNHIDGEYKSDVLLRNLVYEISDHPEDEAGSCVVCRCCIREHDRRCPYVAALAYVNSWAEAKRYATS